MCAKLDKNLESANIFPLIHCAYSVSPPLLPCTSCKEIAVFCRAEEDGKRNFGRKVRFNGFLCTI